MASCEGPGVIAAGTTGTWKDVAMFIPAVAPSRLDGCDFINVRYVLKVSQTFVFVPSSNYFLGFYARKRCRC